MSRWIGRRLAKQFAPMIKHGYAVQGALCKAFYEKYGDEALPIIAEVMGKAGVEQAKIAQSRIKGRDMKAVGELFGMFEMMDMPIEIVELTDERIHYKHPPPCLMGLEGTSKGLCEAVCAARAKSIVSSIIGEEVEEEVIKCVAEDDEYCDVIISKK
ncbi:hypothetical protein DRO56_04330 [Candidatus Bathyarchaeota archaeon]|nr:MAG: hypothetical protein DRO56_04330 [Candidatus Bathyarchaeota archaeon]